MSQKVIGPQFGLDQGPSFKSNQVLGLEFNFGMDMVLITGHDPSPVAGTDPYC